MDENPTPAPVAEGQTTVDEHLAEPTKLPIERSWQVKLHQHGEPGNLPTVEEVEAAIEWGVNAKLGSPTHYFTVSAEII